MLKRMICLLLAATGAVGVMAGPAGAEQYPPAENGISVSDTTPTPGQTVTVTARTFSPGANVVLTLLPEGAPLGGGPAGGDGVVQKDVTIPEGTSLGAHTITAVGQAPSGTLTLSARITVVPAAAAGAPGGPPATHPGKGALPFTGSGLTMVLVQIALALAAAGGVFLALSRRRSARIAG